MARYPPPHMPDLRIRVGDLSFTASWEADAPRTVAAVRGLLPLRAELIHVRWSGEAGWIPLGDLVLGTGFEHETSRPAPGQLLAYAGDVSECEILLPYGECRFSSRFGELAGNHFATLDADDGHDARLRELGRRILREGAQPIEISQLPPIVSRRRRASMPRG